MKEPCAVALDKLRIAKLHADCLAHNICPKCGDPIRLYDMKDSPTAVSFTYLACVKCKTRWSHK